MSTYTKMSRRDYVREGFCPTFRNNTIYQLINPFFFFFFFFDKKVSIFEEYGAFKMSKYFGNLYT